METTNQDKVWEWVANTVQKVENFAIEEVPPFIQEYLQWKLMENTISVCVWSFFFLLLLLSIYLCYKKIWTSSKEFEESVLPISIFGNILFAIPIISCLHSGMWLPLKEIVQINVAPKVYLVEKASQIIKDK
jgi:hypothetical protein